MTYGTACVQNFFGDAFSFKGAFSNNVLTLNKQGGGSVDIPFEGNLSAKTIMLGYRIGLYDVPALDTLANFEQIPDGESFSVIQSRYTTMMGDGLKLFKLNDTLYGLDIHISFDYASIYNPSYYNYVASTVSHYADFRTQPNELQNIFQHMIGNSIPRVLDKYKWSRRIWKDNN